VARSSRREAAEPRRPLERDAESDPRMQRRMIRNTASVSLALLAFGAGVEKGRQVPLPPTKWAGAEWKAFGAKEKQAYLGGFVAGAAAEQALATTRGGPASDSAVLSVAIEQLRAAKQLAFPYAPSVYSAQVDDYYWWTNHLGTAIADVMLTVNRRMRQP
jgi:hypothetical protein